MPVNPRGAATHFDGGDRLATSGGPLALIHNQFPVPWPQIGGSTEVLPRQAFSGATSYYVPAGEDRFVAGGPYPMFRYTAINIVAFDDNTKVFINSPGGTGGTVSLTLNRGQHYTNCLTYQATAPFTCTGGGIDGTAAAGLTINGATKISSTGPVAILLFIGGDTTPWATDFMPILPDLLHGNDYVLPTPGDDPAQQGSRPLNVYPYNPDSVNAISVTASDRTPRTSTIALAASATADYVASVGQVPVNSSVRLTSNRSFWGFALHDHLSPANDWGYSWLASKFLTNSYTVSFAPGVNDPPRTPTPTQRIALGNAQCTIPPTGPNLCDSTNRAPAFVSAALDNTLVKVDFNNDGLYDYIDTEQRRLPGERRRERRDVRHPRRALERARPHELRLPHRRPAGAADLRLHGLRQHRHAGPGEQADRDGLRSGHRPGHRPRSHPRHRLHRVPALPAVPRPGAGGGQDRLPPPWSPGRPVGRPPSRSRCGPTPSPPSLA